MMKFDFAQLYSEIGTDFNLSGMLLKPMRAKLDALGRSIPVLAEKLQADDFVIDFMISARRAARETTIGGPRYLRKRQRVEFSILIPFRDIADFGERVDYVLGQVALGIKLVFDKYGVDNGGVDACAQEMIALAKADPKAYQYPPEVKRVAPSGQAK
jgi:hypothetical protein